VAVIGRLNRQEKLVAHLDGAVASNLIHELSLGTTNADIEIELIWAGTAVPMKLIVREFVPINAKLLQVLVIKAGDQFATFQDKYPFPVAVGELNLGDLIVRCRRYMESVVRNGNIRRMIMGGMNPISRSVLEIVDGYHDATPLSQHVCSLSHSTLSLLIRRNREHFSKM
jgi:hypothetical protein